MNSGPLKVYLQFPKCLSHSTKTNKSSHTVKTWCIYHKQPYKTGDIETALDILFKLIHYHKKLGWQKSWYSKSYLLLLFSLIYLFYGKWVRLLKICYPRWLSMCHDTTSFTIVIILCVFLYNTARKQRNYYVGFHYTSIMAHI